MKRLILAAAVGLCHLHPALAGVDPALQRALIAAKQRADLFNDQPTPFQLDVDFVAQFNVPIRGHLTLKWEAKDRWWRRVDMGDFQQIEVKNGEWHYTARNADFTPVRVGDLINLLSFGAGSEDLIAKKEKRRIERRVEMNCIEVEHKGYAESSHNVCLDSASNEILLDDWKLVADDQRRQRYANYFDFGAHRYPRKLELLVNGSKVVDADVIGLTPTTFDDSLLTPPEGAIKRRECEGLKHPVPIKSPDPGYPVSAGRNGMVGDTTVAMTVLADGSVTDIRLIGSASHSMDDAALRTLKEWKFKPAMCGTEPVVSDITVVMSFRIRN